MMGFAALFASADFVTNTSAHYEFGSLYAKGKPMESAARSVRLPRGGAGCKRTQRADDRGRGARPVRGPVARGDPAPAVPGLRAEIALRHVDRLDDLLRLDHRGRDARTVQHARELRDRARRREVHLPAARDGSSAATRPCRCTTSPATSSSARTGIRASASRSSSSARICPATSSASAADRSAGRAMSMSCRSSASSCKEAKSPTFFYWMTLSTHVPIAPNEGTPRLNCTRGGGPIGQVEVCYMTEMWMDVFEVHREDDGRLAADRDPAGRRSRAAALVEGRPPPVRARQGDVGAADAEGAARRRDARNTMASAKERYASGAWLTPPLMTFTAVAAAGRNCRVARLSVLHRDRHARSPRASARHGFLQLLHCGPHGARRQRRARL